MPPKKQSKKKVVPLVDDLKRKSDVVADGGVETRLSEKARSKKRGTAGTEVEVAQHPVPVVQEVSQVTEERMLGMMESVLQRILPSIDERIERSIERVLQDREDKEKIAKEVDMAVDIVLQNCSSRTVDDVVDFYREEKVEDLVNKYVVHVEQKQAWTAMRERDTVARMNAPQLDGVNHDGQVRALVTEWAGRQQGEGDLRNAETIGTLMDLLKYSQVKESQKSDPLKACIEAGSDNVNGFMRDDRSSSPQLPYPPLGSLVNRSSSSSSSLSAVGMPSDTYVIPEEKKRAFPDEMMGPAQAMVEMLKLTRYVDSLVVRFGYKPDVLAYAYHFSDGDLASMKWLTKEEVQNFKLWSSWSLAIKSMMGLSLEVGSVEVVSKKRERTSLADASTGVFNETMYKMPVVQAGQQKAVSVPVQAAVEPMPLMQHSWGRAASSTQFTHAPGQLAGASLLGPTERMAAVQEAPARAKSADVTREFVDAALTSKVVDLRLQTKLGAVVVYLMSSFSTAPGAHFNDVPEGHGRLAIIAKMFSDKKYRSGPERLNFVVTPKMIGSILNSMLFAVTIGMFKPLTVEEKERQSISNFNNPDTLVDAFGLGRPVLKPYTEAEIKLRVVPSSIEEFKLWAEGHSQFIGLFFGSQACVSCQKLLVQLTEVYYGVHRADGATLRFDLNEVLRCWDRAFIGVTRSATADVDLILNAIKATHFQEQVKSIEALCKVVYVVGTQPPGLTSAFSVMDPVNPQGAYFLMSEDKTKLQGMALMNLLHDRARGLAQGAGNEANVKDTSKKKVKITSKDTSKTIADVVVPGVTRTKEWLPLSRFKTTDVAVLMTDKELKLLNGTALMIAGERNCYNFHGHKGCSASHCKFSHGEPMRSDQYTLQQRLELLIYHGGPVKDAKREPEELIVEVRRLLELVEQSKPSSQGRGSDAFAVNLLPRLINELGASDHPQEQALMAIIAAEKTHDLDSKTSSAVPLMAMLNQVTGTPLREVGMGHKRSDFALAQEIVANMLIEVYPELIESLGPSCAHAMAVATHLYLQRQDEGKVVSVNDLLNAALDEVAKSILPGAQERARKLRPVESNGAGWGVKKTDVIGSVRAVSVSTGLPIVEMGYAEQPSVNGSSKGSVVVFSESFHVQDLGEEFLCEGVVLKGQCVLLVLAFLVNVSPMALVDAFRVDAKIALMSVRPDVVGSTELEVMRLAHEIEHLTQGSHDIHLLRYFGVSYFRSIRLIVVMADRAGGPTEVQVIQHSSWEANSDCKTHMVMLVEGHARPVVRLSSALGSVDLLSKKRGEEGKLKSIPHRNAEAFLAKCIINGVVPSVKYHIEACDYQQDESGRSYVVNKTELAACSLCGKKELFAKTSVARGCAVTETVVVGIFGLDKGTVKPPSVLSNETVLSSSAKGLPGSLLPPSVLSWATEVAHVGGVSKAVLGRVMEKRSEEHRKFGLMSMEELGQYKFSNVAVTVAQQLRKESSARLAAIDRSKVQVKNPTAVQEMADLVVFCRDSADKLVNETGSVRGAMAVYRQVAVKDGGLPLSVNNLKEIEHLLPAPVYEVLKGMAAFGVPLFDMDDEGGAGEELRSPFQSASEASLEIIYGALKDVSQGNCLIFSEKSLAAVDTAGMKFFPCAAVPKKGVDGKPNGEMRPISDLRATNKRIGSSLQERVDAGGFREPPAVCPRLEDIFDCSCVMYCCFRVFTFGCSRRILMVLSRRRI